MYILKKNIFLCGDALGTVRQLSGEGIYYAMLSGKILGKILNGNKDLNKKYIKEIEPVRKTVTIFRIKNKYYGYPPKFIFKITLFFIKIILKISNNKTKNKYFNKLLYYLLESK